jgi:S-adenosylmethionine:diacylglycerol 3-amino-3-carboxypropyl transferase/ubiquinone/menaquinone biosynthesis C-methylase UbiE
MTTAIDDVRLDAPYGSFKKTMLPKPVAAVLQLVIAVALSAIALPLQLVIRVSDSFMAFFMTVHYLYNVSFECPRLESNFLQIGPRDSILTIASAGCNVLHYAVLGATVTAVDLNECQLALLELKLAGVKALTFDEFWSVFGLCDGVALKNLYHGKLRPHLTPKSTRFWDVNFDKIFNLMYSGSSGCLAYVIFRILLPLCGLGFLRKAAEQALPHADFRKLVVKHRYRIRLLSWLIDAVLMPFGAAAAGVPVKQLALAGERRNSMAIVFHKLLFETDFCRDNYFFVGYILGRYTEQCSPEYLKRANWNALKAAVAGGRVKVLHCSVADAARQAAAANESFTVASLLDHLDWLEHEHINDELVALYRCMKPGASIFYRTYADTVHSPPLMWLEPERVPAFPGGTTNLLVNDRVPMYFSAFRIVVGKSRFVPHERCLSWQTALAAPTNVGHAHSAAFGSSTLQNLKVGAQIVVFPLRLKLRQLWQRVGGSGVGKTTHAEQMEAFYEAQAALYDAFREKFLWARSPLAACLPLAPLRAGEQRVWIDIGGGTGRNLEFFPPAVLRQCFSKIVVIDISASLLAVAEKRVAEVGLADLVQCVRGDVLDAATINSLFPAQPCADVVTFSYSLSMIPGKQAALATARRLLKPSGVLGIADFFYNGADRESPLRRIEAALQAAWFRQDGVHFIKALDVAPLFRDLPTELADELKDDEDADDKQSDSSGAKKPALGVALELTYLERFRGSVPIFGPLMRPFHGVLIATSP